MKSPQQEEEPGCKGEVVKRRRDEEEDEKITLISPYFKNHRIDTK
jgi:hypothetical protein